MNFKKLIICFLLAACLLVSSFGCNKNTSGGSSAVAEESQDAVENNGGTEHTAKMDKLFAAGIDKSGARVNVAYGKSYETSVVSSDDYPDKGGKLITDGSVPSGFSKDGVWAGYYIPDRKPFTLTVDLGEKCTNILELHTYILENTSYGVGAPAYLKYYISDDGKDYEYVATAYRDHTPEQNKACDYAVYLNGGLDLRYLRIETSDIVLVWLFVGEVSVIAYGDNYASKVEGEIKGDDYYKFPGVPSASSEKYWDETSDEVINLAKGLKATVSCGGDLSADMATDWYNSTNVSLLTDGKKASKASYSDYAFMHFTRGDTRALYFDLKKISAITGFNAEMLRDGAAGVNFPRFFKVAVSLNGTDWETVISQETVSALDSSAIQTVKADFGKAYKARFVRVSFMVDVHTYISEIEVFGKTNTEGASDIVPDNQGGSQSGVGGNYIMPEDFDGIHNIMLSYNCLPDADGNSTEEGLASKEEYLPYVGYYDKEGNLVDTMFDSFLYLPYTRFNYSPQAQKFTGWKMFVDDIYYPERNMDALNAAAKDVYGKLEKDGKIKVFTSILYTFPNVSEQTNIFGDVDGDGKNEVFDNVADRKKAIKWIMDEELARFKKGNYEYLEFEGFYWFEEQITYSDPHEVELIKFASDYAHQLGYKLIWIPYQQASGYMDWLELGFDMACMQPNYMFRENTTINILYTTAEQTKTLGMCVEMEIDTVNSEESVLRFNEYMIVGAETGYMDAVKVYYQGGFPGAFYQAYKSNVPSARKIYDDVYLFAKEKYVYNKLDDVSVTDGDIELKCPKGRNTKLDLGISDKLDIGKIQITLSPKYGSIMLDKDGAFYYFPPAGYTGVDSFEFCLTDGHSSTKTVKVNINIG